MANRCSRFCFWLYRTARNLTALFFVLLALLALPFYLLYRRFKWQRYYYRIIGFALAGAGAGLVLDELIHGPFTLTPANHEFWGLVLLIVGSAMIAKKPHGKE